MQHRISGLFARGFDGYIDLVVNDIAVPVFNMCNKHGRLSHSLVGEGAEGAHHIKQGGFKYTQTNGWIGFHIGIDTHLFRAFYHIPSSDMFDQIHGHHRSEEHTSELQSLMRISYAVFCLKKKKKDNKKNIK